MSCPEDRISAWIDGELSERDAIAVDQHVSGCASCRELVSSFRSLSQSFKSELSSELSSDVGFIVRFRERRDEVSVAPWWTWRQLALRLVPLAAAVLVAALAALSIESVPSAPLQTVEQEALGAPVAFDNGPESVLRIAFEPFPEDIE